MSHSYIGQLIDAVLAETMPGSFQAPASLREMYVDLALETGLDIDLDGPDFRAEKTRF